MSLSVFWKRKGPPLLPAACRGPSQCSQTTTGRLIRTSCEEDVCQPEIGPWRGWPRNSVPDSLGAHALMLGKQTSTHSNCTTTILSSQHKVGQGSRTPSGWGERASISTWEGLGNTKAPLPLTLLGWTSQVTLLFAKQATSDKDTRQKECRAWGTTQGAHKAACV